LERENPSATPFDIDPEKGIIRSQTLDARVAVFGSLGWATMEVELDSIFITGAVVILQRMGYSYGKYLGVIVKRKADKVDPVGVGLQSLAKMAKDSGWGNLSQTGGDLRSGTFTMVMKDCIFCVNMKKKKDPRCHFLVGILAGFADEVTGFNHRAREEQCIAKEDTHCEFIVERVAEQSQRPQF
jgi:predicted hydrocarbon binding protein